MNKQKSIRDKLLTVILSITCVTMIAAMILTLISSYISNYLQTHKMIELASHKIESMARMHYNPKNYGDLDVFFTNLSLYPLLDNACYYDHNNQLASQWSLPQYPCLKEYTEAKYKSDNDHAHIYKNIKIEHDDKKTHHIVMKFDLDEALYEAYYKIIFFAISTAIALLIGYFLTRPIIHSVTAPIFHLATLASILSEKQDYSLRAKKFNDDELGLRLAKRAMPLK